MGRAAAAVGVECKQPDKNQERGLAFTIRQQWAEQLKGEDQPPIVLLLTLQLLCLHVLKLVRLPLLSLKIYKLNGIGKSIPPQNHQLILNYYQFEV